MLRNKKALYCFSPPVMLATFAIELVFLIYVVARYKMNNIARIISAMLVCLAFFQFAEYSVCAVGGSNASLWSRLGFIAITLLPPLGIHLIYEISGKKWSRLVGSAYATGLAWVIIFGFSEMIFRNHVCNGNYVIFDIKPLFGGAYFIYYYFWLIIGAILSYKFAKNLSPKPKESLTLLIFGYLILLVPTTITNMLSPGSIDAKPSIMCGFAIILAFIITFGILPRSGKLKNGKSSK